MHGARPATLAANLARDPRAVYFVVVCALFAFTVSVSLCLYNICLFLVYVFVSHIPRILGRLACIFYILYSEDLPTGWT
jgi:hypothetical protein